MSLMGELLCTFKGRLIGHRILDADIPKVETSIEAQVELKNSKTAVGRVTYYSILRNAGVYYTEGQGLIINNDSETVSWKGYGIGRYENKTKFDRGVAIFKSWSDGWLSYLENAVGIFIFELDQAGNSVGSIWELKEGNSNQA